MSIENNYLRRYRKRSDLTHFDIAFLMSQSDYSNIGRYEHGERTPSNQMLLVYHLLFDIPLTSLFERQKDDIHEDLIVRVGLLLRNLKLATPSPKIGRRIAFLESALTKLSA